MKIVIVIGYFDVFSNYGEVCLARELVRQGHEVTVIAGDHIDYIFPDSALAARGLSRRYPLGESEVEGIKIIRLEPVFNKRAMIVAPGVNELIEKIGPELIICMKPGQILSTTVRRPKKGATIVSVFDDNRSQYFNLGRVAATLKRAIFYSTKGFFYFRLARQSDLLFSNTPNGCSIVQPLALGKKMEVLPLSFDETVYYPDAALREQHRKALGLSEKDLLWITTGKVIPEKRIDLLIEIFKKLHAEKPSMKLVVIGMAEDAHCNELRAQVERCKLGASVHLLGFKSPKEIVGYVNAADIGIWHKRPAISIQQALGTGLFCVLPNDDMVGHLLTPETGEYFPANDWAALEATLRSCSNRSPSEYQAGRDARAKSNLRFSQPAVVQHLLARARGGGVAK